MITLYYSYEDISLYYEKYGNKPNTIVILPGWGDTRHTFDSLISVLSLTSTVYILDYPGFGKTKFPNHSMTIYDYANMIHSWVKDLNLEDPLFIGHSFGGRLLILLSGYYHYNYSNFIFLDAAGIKPKKTLKVRLRNLRYSLLKKIARILPKKKRKDYLNSLFQKFASSDYLSLEESMRPTFRNVVNTDLSYYLKNITSRVLLIWGENDSATPIGDAKRMKKEIPNSELIILKGLGHFPYLERGDWVYQIIFAHLQEINFFKKN